MNTACFRLTRSLVGLICGVLLAGAAEAQTAPARLPVRKAEAVVKSPAIASTDYRLNPNDVVEIKVFQEEELEATTRIAKDGMVAFPLIGRVNIGGKTAQEGAQLLETRLKEYLVQPQVTVRVVEYTKRRYTVLGQVIKPGNYDLPDDGTINLLDAIGTAGGYSRIANPSKITVKRLVNGQETIFKLNAKKMADDIENKRFEVLPGDTITVAESAI